MKKIRNLYGLVLAGGLSARMMEDKSLIRYHGKSQVEHCCELLLKFTDNVFISNREDQSNIDEHQIYPQIHDAYTNIGPLGGILTALEKFPKVSWIILACDLPFADEKTLQKLIKERDVSKNATAYLSAQKPHLPEPLCAIYEQSSLDVLKAHMSRGLICPRKILIQSRARFIELDDKSSLDNANTKDEYNQAKRLLHKKS